jgi:HEAT repeats
MIDDRPESWINGPDPFFASLFVKSRNEDLQERIDAALELGAWLSTPGVIERLIQMLDDENEAVIQAAAEALVIRGDLKGTMAVLSVLAGPDGIDEPGQMILAITIADLNYRRIPVRTVLLQVAESSVSPAIQEVARYVVRSMSNWRGEYSEFGE